MKKAFDWKIKKANKTIELINKLKEKQKLPLYTLRDLEHTINEILGNGYYITLCSETKEFYEKENYTIKTDGIGWKISF